MTVDGNVVLESRPAARGVLLALCVIVLTAIPALLGYPEPWHVLIAAYALPVAAIALSISSFRLVQKGPDAPSNPSLIVGFFFIFGGVTFDIVATLLHSSDLSQESNVVARLLLDAGYSMIWVYTYGAFLQSLVLFNMCVLWAAFLRHRRTFVTSSFTLAPDSFPRFLKAATGGGELTWREWLIPLTLHEMPSAYHLVWISSPLVIAGAAYRWYLGFEWFGILPYVDKVVLVSSTIAISLLVYVIWLHRQYVACRPNVKI